MTETPYNPTEDPEIEGPQDPDGPAPTDPAGPDDDPHDDDVIESPPDEGDASGS